MKSRLKIDTKNIILLCFGLSLTACSTINQQNPDDDFDKVQDAAPSSKVDWNKVKPVTPKYEPKSRYGNPKSYEQNGHRYKLLASAENHKEKGIASWYGTKFHGRRTSSGETYDMLKMTAAHKTLPIPVYAKVTNLENGKQVVVKINDRGPFAKGRIIDLSYAAAHAIGMTNKGTAKVEIETITFSQDESLIEKPPTQAYKIEPTTAAPVVTSVGNTLVGNELSQKGQQITHVGKKRFVQVGAFSVHKTAQKLAKVLDREIRLPVKITNLVHKGKKLYRVRIGPVPTEDLANELLKTLDIKELGQPKIVYE